MKKSQLLIGVALGWLVLGTGCAQPSGDELLALARDAASSGDSRTATIHLRNLLREQPDHAAARLLLGQVMLAQGDPVEAEAAFRRALELGQDAAEVQLPLLQAIFRQGRFQAVLDQIASGPALEGAAGIEVIRLTAQSHRGANRPEEAEAVLRAALENDPDSVQLRTDLASLLMSQNRLADGREIIVGVLSDDATYPPALTLRGRLETLTGRLEDAERSFREAIERGGPNGEAYFDAMTQLVELLTIKGDLEGANEGADELIAKYPSHPVVVTLKANVELRSGDVEAAKRRLGELLGRVPGFGPANRLAGIISAGDGQVEQAEMFLQRALVQVPSDRRALLHLANLHLDQGNVDDALDVLASGIGADMPSSDALAFAMAGAAAIQLNEGELGDKLLSHAMSALSGDSDELLAVAGVLIGAGRAQRAQELLSGSSAIGDEAWTTTFALALSQIQEQKFDEADDTVERLVSLQPDVAWPLNLRGMLAAARQNYGDAIEYFSSALAVEPGYVPAHLNRARIHMIAGRTADAVADYRATLQSDPLNAAALMALTEVAINERRFEEARQWIERMPPSVQRTRYEGTLAMVEGRPEEAAQKLMQVFQRQPTSDNAVLAYTAARNAGTPNPEAVLVTWVAEHPRDLRANLLLGSIYTQAGEHDRAIQRYEAALEVQPDQPEALNNLAWLYQERGDMRRALDLAKRAYDAASDNPSIADTLGWLYVQSDDAREGLPLLERAHAAVPGNADIHYHWAVALADTGDEDAAAQALRELLAAHSEFADRTDAEQLLRELE